MKRFFKNKEAGAITPLPPQSPTTSSFEGPREFDQYQRHQQHRLSSPLHPAAQSDQQYKRQSQQSDINAQYGALPPSLRPGQIVPRHHESGPYQSSRLSAPYMQQGLSDQSTSNTASQSGHDRSSDEQERQHYYTGRRSSLPHQDAPRRQASRRAKPPYMEATREVQQSDAYPVYSGGPDDGEVMVSQGHLDDDAHPESKDKSRKKLFAFSSAARDKKLKPEREPHYETREDYRHHSGPLSPPTEPVHRAKEGGWIDKWSKRAQSQQDSRLQDKELEAIVASNIGWLAANANTEEEWMSILQLIDMVSHSEAASKEAVRALRKEFKYGTVDSQRRAVRIWALLTFNSSDRFRFQVATKKFLDSVEDTISSSKTPLSVKDTMLRVLGVLAFEFQNDAELSLVTKCWNKVKPSDRPKNGEPLENDLFEFKLPQQPRRGPQQQHVPPPDQRQAHQQYHQQSPPSAAPKFNGHREQTKPRVHNHQQYQDHQPSALHQQQQRYAAPDPPAHDQHSPWSAPTTAPAFQPQEAVADESNYDVVQNFENMVGQSPEAANTFLPKADTESTFIASSFDEDIRRLLQECQTAKSHANVLIDTVVHDTSDNSSADLIEEFYGKVLRSQEQIVSQIPWASAQADQSRDRLDQQRAMAASENVHLPPAEETEEERLLAELLETHGRLTEASSLVDEMHRRLAEEEEERRVTERSKVEVRLDRSALAQDSVTGQLYDMDRGRMLDPYSSQNQQASGSRSASPNLAASQRSTAGKDHTFSPPPLVLSPPTGSGLGSGARVSRPLPVPRSELSTDSGPPSSISAKSHHHPHVSSLQAASHSTNSASRLSLNHSVVSGGSESRTHSRDTSQSSQFAPSLTHPHRTTLSSGSDNSNLVSPPITRSLPLTPPALSISATSPRRDLEEDDDLQTPIVPSEKALGKRRAVSVRYPSQTDTHPALQASQAFSALRLDSQ